MKLFSCSVLIRLDYERAVAVKIVAMINFDYATSFTASSEGLLM